MSDPVHIFPPCPRCGYPGEKDLAQARRGAAGKGEAKARTSAQASKAAKERWRKWREAKHGKTPPAGGLPTRSA